MEKPSDFTFDQKNASPLTAVAGSMRDDPYWDEYLKAIEDYRAQKDAEEMGDELTVYLSPAWRKLRGNLENEPLFDEWQEAIAAYREHKDKEEGI